MKRNELQEDEPSSSKSLTMQNKLLTKSHYEFIDISSSNRVIWCEGETNEIFIYDLTSKKLLAQYQGVKLKEGALQLTYHSDLMKFRRNCFICSVD